MFQSTTLNGLDEALRDLQKAIENLPDGAKKKRLLREFERLEKERSNLGGSRRTRERDYLALTAFTLIMVIGFLLLFYLRPRHPK